MVEFYKKKSVTNFAELSATFPDLYDSTGGLNYGRTFSLSGASAATHSHYGYSSIKGGPSKSKGFFRTQVANLPTFGSAELKRMDGYVYIEDVVLDNNSSLTPSIGSFLIKPDSVPDSLATGKLRLQETTRGMGHISAFSSSVDSYISDQETFTGIDSTYSYDSHVEVQAVGRRVFKMSGALYLEVADAYPHARRIDQNGQKVEDYGHDFKKFSVKYSTFMDNPLTGTRRKVVKIQKRKNEYWRSYGADWTAYFKHSAIVNLIQGNAREDVSSEPEYKNQITTGNTFFDVVKHDRELILSKADKDPHLVGTCLSRFSTDELLGNDGQSMEMYAFWDGDTFPDNLVLTNQTTGASAKDLYVPFSNPDPASYTDTQNTFVTYGPVPFPAHIFPGELRNEPIIVVDDASTNHTDNTILSTAHQLTAGCPVAFPAGLGTTTIASEAVDTSQIYFVSSTGLTADAFRFGTDQTGGGTPLTLTNASESGGDQTYTSVALEDVASPAVYQMITSDYGTHSNGTIEIDISLKNLEAALCYNDSIDKISMTKRSFVVTYGYWKPSTTDTLESYIDRHIPFTGDNSAGNGGIVDGKVLLGGGTGDGDFDVDACIINNSTTLTAATDDADAFDEVTVGDKIFIKSGSGAIPVATKVVSVDISTNPQTLVMSAASTGGSNTVDITFNRANHPFMGWSFIRTKGASSKLEDGLHIVTSNKWQHNANGGTAVNNKHDIYIEDVSNSHDNQTIGIPTAGNAGNLPEDSYFTFRIIQSPCTLIGNRKVYWGLFDPKTDEPIPLKSDDVGDFNVNGTTHFFGNKTTNYINWRGKRGIGPTTTGDFDDYLGGTQFWAQGTGGGVDYFQNSNERGGGPIDENAIYPRYLTLWLNNYPNMTTDAGTTADKFLAQDGGNVDTNSNNGTNDVVVKRATTSSVFVDGIRFRDYNFDHSNATVPDNGLKTGNLIIPSNIAAHGFPAVTYNYGWTNKYPGSTTLTFGSDTRGAFRDASLDKGILLNDFTTQLNNNDEIPFYHMSASFTTDYDADKYETGGAIGVDSVSFATETAGGESFFGNQARTSHVGGGSFTNVAHDKTLRLDLDSAATNALVLDGTTNSVDAFTNKGFLHIKGSIETANDVIDTISATAPEVSRRECIYTSARILRVADRVKGIYKVDTTEIFKGHENDTFIAYLYGAGYRATGFNGAGSDDTLGGGKNASCTTIKLLEIIDDRHVRLSWDGLSNSNHNMATEKQLPYLFISPLKYWLFVNVQNYTTSMAPKVNDNEYGATTHTPLASKSYSSAILTTETADVTNVYGTVGPTFNETLYLDAPTIQGTYENKWTHDVGPESIIDISDFGFGAYSEDTLEGGNAGMIIPKVGKYNKIKMNKVISTANLEAGETVEFILESLDATKHEVIYHNSIAASAVSSAGTGHDERVPYFVTVFEDEKPSNPKLTVQPYEEDPFLPEFKWEAGDEDLWYGFLIIDDKPINSQYHEGILHLPFNDEGDNGAHPSTVPANKLYKNNTDSGTTSETANMADALVVHDLEGLAGNCLMFSGADTDSHYVEYNPSSGNTLTQLDASDEASLVIHCIPNFGMAGTHNTLVHGEQFQIRMASTGVVTAHFWNTDGDYVTLTSPAVTIDGETPTNIIVTFDKNLKAGNCKLYINGKLADQSGFVGTANIGAGGNNWKKGEYLRAGTDPFRIGASRDANGTETPNATYGFDGRIEEIVVYKKCIYPIVPSDGSLVLDKPLKEISGGIPISYNARLFVKDYHNIRGSTTSEVAASSPTSYRKAAFNLGD